MKEEFNLSEKILWKNCYPIQEGCLRGNDVKEFIFLEGVLLGKYLNGVITWEELVEQRIKLAGKELSNSKHTVNEFDLEDYPRTPLEPLSDFFKEVNKMKYEAYLKNDKKKTNRKRN